MKTNWQSFRSEVLPGAADVGLAEAADVFEAAGFDYVQHTQREVDGRRRGSLKITNGLNDYLIVYTPDSLVLTRTLKPGEAVLPLALPPEEPGKSIWQRIVEAVVADSMGAQ